DHNMHSRTGQAGRFCALSALAIMVAAPWTFVSLAQQPARGGSTEGGPPKLAVLIVIDQMRAEYVDRFKSDWTGGFKRLLRDAAWFSRAEYPYLFTVTCAGHATIATGTFPH